MARVPARPEPKLRDVVEQAKALAGDEWLKIRTWPLESGLIYLADKLKG
jgi:hypothetical protein